MFSEIKIYNYFFKIYIFRNNNWELYIKLNDSINSRIRASIVVSIPACHAGDRSSILRLGVFFPVFYLDLTNKQTKKFFSMFNIKYEPGPNKQKVFFSCLMNIEYKIDNGFKAEIADISDDIMSALVLSHK